MGVGSIRHDDQVRSPTGRDEGRNRKPVGAQRRSDLALIARTIDDEQEPIGNPRLVPLTCQVRGAQQLNIPVRVPHWRKVGGKEVRRQEVNRAHAPPYPCAPARSRFTASRRRRMSSSGISGV